MYSSSSVNIRPKSTTNASQNTSGAGSSSGQTTGQTLDDYSDVLIGENVLICRQFFQIKIFNKY